MVIQREKVLVDEERRGGSRDTDQLAVVFACDVKCAKPIMVKGVLVRCNKCMNCRIARSREWSTRILHESGYHDHSVFLTLTYDNEHLPENNALDKKGLQKFIKRLRRDLGDRKIKYYAAGEYGEKSFRPHYHLIVLGLANRGKDMETLRENWPFGYVYGGTVTPDSVRYVTDYIQKKYDGKKAEGYYPADVKPFQLCSLGMGKQFALDNREYLEGKLGLTVHGVEVGLPKYYRRVLEIDSEKIAENAERERSESVQRFRDKYGINAGDKWRESNRQSIKNAEARARLVVKDRL